MLIGFATCVHTSNMGQGDQVTAKQCLLCSQLLIRQLPWPPGVKPTKLYGSIKLIPRLTQMLDGWCKTDPPTKKLLVESDVPAYLCYIGQSPAVMPLEAAVGDLTLIAFYYLLHVGEYTCKNLQQYKTNSSILARGHNMHSRLE